MIKLFSLAMVIFAVTLVITPACTPSAEAPPQYRLRMGIIPTQSCLPYLVMKERGLDKKYGLELISTEFPGGDPVIAAIAAGKLDMGIGGSISVLTAAENGMIPGKIVPVAAINLVDAEHPFIGVVVSHSINGWKDLEGKQIAINAVNSPNMAAIKGRLQIEGVKDYKLPILSFANMGLAVADGTVDAATLVEPYLTQSLLRNDGKFLDWIVGGPPFEKMQMTMLYFNGDIYRNNPQEVKAFLRAYVDALDWIAANKDESRAIIGKMMNLSNEVTQKMRLMNFSLDGRNNPQLLESMQPVMINVGMLKAPIPANRLYDETLLNEVLRERNR
jgi:ABC-type nitrate/sulfonate/bicarbonate transport system substrate-binding protein